MTRKEWRGSRSWDSKPKRIPTEAEYLSMLKKIEEILPNMSRDDIIKRAVERYYYRQTERNQRIPLSQILIRQEHRCLYCGIVLSLKTATVDHWIPLGRGGTNTDDNVVAACEKCNLEKESMTGEEFFEFRRQSTASPLTNTPLGV